MAAPANRFHSSGQQVMEQLRQTITIDHDARRFKFQHQLLAAIAAEPPLFESEQRQSQ